MPGSIAIVHIGDTHARVDARSGDQLAALDAAIAIGRRLSDQRELAAWIWPGDLYHSMSEPDTRNALQVRAIEMARLAPVVIVRGNHDLPGELEVFGRLGSGHRIYVSETPELLLIETPVDGPVNARLAVFTLPYPNKATLVAAGTPPDRISQAARAALDGIVLHAADALEATGPWTIKVFAGHANIAGAVSSVGQPQIGNDLELDATMLERLPASCYVAMNHIHKHQQLGRAVYAGSICRMDFGELEPKGVVVASWTDDAVTLDGKHVEGLIFEGWSFVPLDVPPMYQVEGKLTPQGFTYRVVSGSGAALEIPPGLGAVTGGSFRGADVRVRYTYNRAEAAALNVAHIHAEFAEARSLKIEAVPAQEHEIRAPEVVAAPTLVAKLEHYATRQGIPWSSTLAAKAAALESDACDNWRHEALSRIAAVGRELLP